MVRALITIATAICPRTVARRSSLALAIAILCLAGYHHASPAFAVTYPAGWNLVSGPNGSTLTGDLHVIATPWTNWTVTVDDASQ